MAFVGSRIWSGFQSRASYVGRTVYLRDKWIRSCFFALAVRFDVYIARIITLPTVRLEKPVSVERLSEIFLELQEQGANNINLVTPTHFVPQIIAALDQARKKWA